VKRYVVDSGLDCPLRQGLGFAVEGNSMIVAAGILLLVRRCPLYVLSIVTRIIIDSMD
jgi:hypothetical protein